MLNLKDSCKEGKLNSIITRSMHIGISLFVCAVVVVSSLGSVSAQVQDSGKSGLNIGPLRHELVIQRGSTGTINMRIENISGTDIIATPQINDFQTDNQTGQPRIIVDNSKEKPTNSLRWFATKTDPLPLKTGEKKDVTVNFEVPKDAVPGGYYGIVRYTAVKQSGSEEGKVSLNASVGAIILVSVPGQVTEGFKVTKIVAQKNGSPESLFFSAPNQAAVTVENTGNGFARPTGTVSIKGGFSNKEISSYEMNSKQPRGNVLPDSTRTFVDSMKGVKQPGRYVITATIAQDTGREIVVARGTFWYLPVWFLVIFFAILAALVALIFIVWRKIKGETKTKSRRRR